MFENSTRCQLLFPAASYSNSGPSMLGRQTLYPGDDEQLGQDVWTTIKCKCIDSHMLEWCVSSSLPGKERVSTATPGISPWVRSVMLKRISRDLFAWECVNRCICVFHLPLVGHKIVAAHLFTHTHTHTHRTGGEMVSFHMASVTAECTQTNTHTRPDVFTIRHIFFFSSPVCSEDPDQLKHCSSVPMLPVWTAECWLQHFAQ